MNSLTLEAYDLKLSELRKRFLFTTEQADQIVTRWEAEHVKWKTDYAKPEQLEREESYLSEMRSRIVTDVKEELEKVESRCMGSLPRRGHNYILSDDASDTAAFPPRHIENLPAVIRNDQGPWRGKLDGIIHNLGKGSIFVLHGSRGTGKTLLATALARYRLEKHRSASAYMVLADLFSRIKRTFKAEGETEDDILWECGHTPLLVLDEVHEIRNTEWQARIFTLLIDGRYRSKRDTVLITNEDEQTFLASVGPSIADRIAECGYFIACDWSSFRRQGRL